MQDGTQTVRYVPIGEEWRDRGWKCYACEGRVWWIKNTSFDAVFLRDVPVCHEIRGDGRIRLERVVDWCLLCHDTRSVLKSDCLTFGYMICIECSEILHQSSLQFLTQKKELPPAVACLATRFLDV